jgi:glucose/arabinose dehydrogenase
MKHLRLGVGIIFVAGLAACSFLLPEGMVIRGPILRSLLGSGIDPPADSVVESRFKVPDGYRVELFAEGVSRARVLRFSPNGSLLVSQPREGQILHVLADQDGDGRSDGQRVLVSDLDRPHGLDFRDGFLFIGETGAIARIPYTESGLDTLKTTGPLERIVADLPPGKNHWSKTLRFGPDGGLYLHVGSSCNVCEEEDERRATIMRFEADGSGAEIYASGLRNSVGFDWRPGTDELYATDNGRDLLGDNYPACELNLIERGGFYGWPYANANMNGDTDIDPDFGDGNEDRVAATTAPAHPFRAHNAPLGISFLRHPAVPAPLRGAALVALHGSWNRSKLDGYKVVSLHWDARGQISERDFLTGFEVGEDVIGRPADVLEGPDGSIFVSDDYAGAIYRVHRGAASSSASLAHPSARPSAVDNPLAEVDADTQEALDLAGHELFVANACGTCHLADEAAAGIVTKPLDGLAAKYSLSSLTGFFVAPTPPMPVYELTPEERRALAVHLLSRFE